MLAHKSAKFILYKYRQMMEEKERFEIDTNKSEKKPKFTSPCHGIPYPGRAPFVAPPHIHQILVPDTFFSFPFHNCHHRESRETKWSIQDSSIPYPGRAPFVAPPHIHLIWVPGTFFSFPFHKCHHSLTRGTKVTNQGNILAYMGFLCIFVLLVLNTYSSFYRLILYTFFSRFFLRFHMLPNNVILPMLPISRNCLLRHFGLRCSALCYAQIGCYILSASLPIGTFYIETRL